MIIKNKQICPYASECVSNKNYAEKTKDERINIIRYNKTNGFSCDAMNALEDVTHEGIEFTEEFKENVKDDIGLSNTGCSHITLLNLVLNKK